MNRTTLTGLLPALCLLLTAILSAPSLPAQEKKPDAPAPKAAPEKPAPPAGEKPKEAAKPAPARQASDDDEAYKQIELFTRVLEIVRQNYVDPEKTSYEKLINSALAGMLGDLDPHSQFMQPKVYEQLQQNTGSTYEGVGITISTRNDILSIVSVREDGPAARAGVLPGDQILKINDLLTEDIGLTEAITLLKGKPGEKVKMTLRRPSTKELIEVEMTREIIKQSTLKDITLLDPNLTNPYKIGYARLLQFSDPSADELADALDDLEQKGMQAFILDLRNNPGGLLNVAIDIIGEFVPAGSLVLTTEGKPGSGEVRPYRTTADRKRRDREYPVAILMNYASASGSEVVAGALQDMQRAIIVGETSFGKGSVQSIMPLDGSEGKAIRLTTAKYYTPSHRTIHENGVIPNIVASLTPKEEEQLARWFNREGLNPDERKKIENFQDLQLIRAVDAMKGALVYTNRKNGNGGAKPGSEPAKEVVQAAPKKDEKAPEVPKAKEAPEKKDSPTAPTPAAPKKKDGQ
ncbi:MAG: PDZ domain-containing protein [Verrucomicrobiae bacterium]|nr:PDZ domain-containing protein [Verrucomicrobiae bacterium]